MYVVVVNELLICKEEVVVVLSSGNVVVRCDSDKFEFIVEDNFICFIVDWYLIYIKEFYF